MERLRSRPSLRALIGLASLLTLHVLTAALWAQGPPGAPGDPTFFLSHGVVARADGSAIFLMRPEGGVEAVEIGLGRTLWTSEDASRPLAARGNLLLAQAESAGRGNAFDFVLLDQRRGDTRRRARLDLDAEIWTGIDDGLGAALTLDAWDDGPDFLIAWSCREETVGGAVMERPPAREAEGGARFAAADGRLQAVDPAGLRPPPRPGFVVPAAHQLASESGRQFLSADGKHILVSEKIADERTWLKYRWILYESTSGERLGETLARWSMTPFFVTGTTLVHAAPPYERRLDGAGVDAAPLSVRAVDLVSGNELWLRPLRDTRYRGPFPP